MTPYGFDPVEMTGPAAGSPQPRRSMPQPRRVSSLDAIDRESLLTAFLDASPLAAHLVDLRGRVLLWNRAAERMFGWSCDAVLGSLDPTVGGDELADWIQRVRESPGPVRQEVVRLDRSGNPVEVDLTATAVVSRDGGVTGILQISADLRERRRIQRERDDLLEWEREARERAEAAERRTRFLAQGSALLDDSLDYLATLNNLARLAVPTLCDYCLIDELENDCVSRVALAHVDSERELLLRRNVQQPLTGDPAKHPVVQVMLTGKSVLVEETNAEVLRGLAHDADHFALLRALELHSFLIVPLEKSGRILGAMTLAYAESRRRYTRADLEMAEELARRAASAVEAARLYRESQRAVQARERLLAVVSHDLRNSLATVLLNASAILESESARDLPGSVNDQLQWIARSADQMNRLIADLLDFSAIELGRLSLELSPQSPAKLVHDAARMYAPLADERHIRLETEVADTLPAIRADAGRILQVLGNLLTNAIKFAPRYSPVGLTACEAGGEVLFTVADAGPGIEPELLASIFDRFWHGRRGSRGGAGLGLGIARAIVEGHSGRIWAESTPGRGATFHFTIPIHADD